MDGRCFVLFLLCKSCRYSSNTSAPPIVDASVVSSMRGWHGHKYAVGPWQPGGLYHFCDAPHAEIVQSKIYLAQRWRQIQYGGHVIIFEFVVG